MSNDQNSVDRVLEAARQRAEKLREVDPARAELIAKAADKNDPRKR